MAKSEIKMKMSLDSSGVTSALTKAKTSIKQFADSSIEKLGSLSKVGIAGLVTGFAAASKAALSYSKEMTNLANIAGVGFVEFQKLAAAAQSVGIEKDKMADILKDVNDKMGDYLENKAGPLKDFFDNIAPAIDITSKAFRGLSSRDTLQLYYDSLKKANVSQERMAFYMEAIGNDATALVPLLKNAGKGFKDYGEAAEEAGRIMDEATAKSLKKAQEALDQFSVKMTIMAGETIMGFKIISDAAKSSDVKGGIQGLGKLIAGVATSNSLLMKKGADNLTGFFSQMDAGAEESYNKIHGDAKVFEMNFEDISNNIKNEFIDTTQSITEADRKSTEKRQETADKLASIHKKIRAEEGKQLDGLTDTTGKLVNAEAERLRLQEELSKLDPFTDEIARAEKQLELEKAITVEQKLAAEAQAEADQNALEAEEAKKQATFERLETELAIALASGDEDAIRLAQEKLDLESAIYDMVSRTNLNYDEAKVKIEAINKQLKEEKSLHTKLLEAQADQNVELQNELEKQIDLLEKIDMIHATTNKRGEEAINLAKKLQAIQSGPDLNQSGVVTPREQKEFERQQKIKTKQQEQRLRDEIAEEGRRGGNIRNVSKEKRGRDLGAERAARAEKKLREAEDVEIGRRKRFGEDEADIMADINARRQAREGGGGGAGPGGGGAGPGGGGGGGGAGKGPKVPEDPAKATNKKLDEQIQLLKDIKKSLAC